MALNNITNYSLETKLTVNKLLGEYVTEKVTRGICYRGICYWGPRNILPGKTTDVKTIIIIIISGKVVLIQLSQPTDWVYNSSICTIKHNLL